MTEQEIKELYKKYRVEFVNWASFKFNISSDMAKDVFQDSVIALMQNINKGKMKNEPSQLKSYLYGIAKNKINDCFRKNKGTVSLGDSLIHLIKQDEQNEETILSDANISLMGNAINELGSPCGDLLSMYYFYNQSMEQIALKFNYSNADTAKAQKYKCMERLKKIFFATYNPNA